MLLLLLLPVLVLVTGCSGLRGTGDLEYVPGEGNVLQIDADDRGDPVEVSGQTLQDGALDLADLRGQVVVVNVWWSGCMPCRTEMPMLVDVAADSDPDDVAFVGIDIRDSSRDTAIAFESEFGVEYPSLFDPSSETLLDFGKYAPTSPPSTLILDREGRVAVLVSGAIPSEQTLTDLLDETTGEDA